MLFRYNTGLGLLLLRVVLAIVFIAHGAQKLFGIWGGGGISGTAGFFDSLGIPLPGVMAVASGILEFFGGILLALGLLTRPVALLLAIEMLVATATVHWPQGFFVSTDAFGIEFTMVLMVAALTLVFTGSGRLSVDEGLRRELSPSD